MIVEGEGGREEGGRGPGPGSGGSAELRDFVARPASRTVNRHMETPWKEEIVKTLIFEFKVKCTY